MWLEDSNNPYPMFFVTEVHGSDLRMYYKGAQKRERNTNAGHPLSKRCPEPAKRKITEKAVAYSDRSDGGSRQGSSIKEQPPKTRFIFCSQGL